jgi:hypothetical protein
MGERALHPTTDHNRRAFALALSLALVGLGHFGFTALEAEEPTLLGSIDFTDVLMQGMLSLLLFAGSLHVELRQLPLMLVMLTQGDLPTVQHGISLFARFGPDRDGDRGSLHR